MIGPEALARLQEVVRQLRAIPQVRERSPGVFTLLGQTYVQLHDADGKCTAELRKLSGSGTERYPLDSAPEQRKFVDEAKRRATKLTDE